MFTLNKRFDYFITVLHEIHHHNTHTHTLFICNNKFLLINNNELNFQEMYGTSTKVSMWKCYSKVYWKEFLLGGVLKMMGDFVGYIGPLGVSVIVNFVAQENHVTNLTNTETVSIKRVKIILS